MSDQINAGKMKETKRIEPIFWENKRFIAVSEILKENPRRNDVAGWHSLQLIRQGGEVGIGYRDWKNNMPTNIPNALDTNHKHLEWDLDRGRIRVVSDTRTAEAEDRIRGKGAPSPQKARAASVMENVGSTTYVLKYTVTSN
ncbi:MAG: hypothetical protein ACRYG8_09655 [Janthinobacterium lividum]